MSNEVFSSSDNPEESADQTGESEDSHMFRQRNKNLMMAQRDALRNMKPSKYAPISGLSLFSQSELEDLLEKDDIVD